MKRRVGESASGRQKERFILILEDNAERISGFQSAAHTLGLVTKIWSDAATMIAEMDEFLDSAALLSLDHDLAPDDPLTGLAVARQLVMRTPTCPVILHSSNYERVFSMHNELRDAGWQVERVGPIGDDWIENVWLPFAKRLIAK